MSNLYKTGSVIQCLFEVDMRNGHDGLKNLAKKNGVSVDSLTPGSYLIFVNKRKSSLKVYAANQVVAYYRPSNHRVDLNMIRNIPRVFNASKRMDFDEALRETLITELTPKRRRIIERVGKRNEVRIQ